MNKQRIAKTLRQFFRRKPEVTLAYLFGSMVRGDRHALSDIDVAVLLNKVPAESLDYKIRMTTELSKALDTEHVDLVILNETPPRLRFEVVHHGEALFVRNDEIRCDFEVRARLEYFDVRPLLELQYDYMKKRIEEGKFGTKLFEN